jgi:hypothetical protein
MTKVWLAALVGATVVVSAVAVSMHKRHSETSTPQSSAGAILYYRDPMHPSYTSDKPGKAPDCGMELEPVYKDTRDSDAKTALTLPGTIRLNPEQRQMIGVTLASVEKSAAAGTLRTIGRVVVEEDRVFPVTAGGEGWVTQLSPGTATGDFVKKGQALAVVYGREYATAERTFLYALRSLESSRSANLGDYQDQPAVVIQEARLVLQNMGFRDAQIQQLEKNRQIIWTSSSPPADGVIVARNILCNEFDRGAGSFESRILACVDLGRFVRRRCAANPCRRDRRRVSPGPAGSEVSRHRQSGALSF